MKFKPPEKMPTAALLAERTDCVQVLRETDQEDDPDWYAAVYQDYEAVRLEIRCRRKRLTGGLSGVREKPAPAVPVAGRVQ